MQAAVADWLNGQHVQRLLKQFKPPATVAVKQALNANVPLKLAFCHPKAERVVWFKPV